MLGPGTAGRGIVDRCQGRMWALLCTSASLARLCQVSQQGGRRGYLAVARAMGGEGGASLGPQQLAWGVARAYTSRGRPLLGPTRRVWLP